MKKSKFATLNEAIVCKYSGKKYLSSCMTVLSILLLAAAEAVYFADIAGLKATIDELLPVEGVLVYVALAVAGIVAGIVLGLIWGALVNMFRVPAANKKEQKSYLDMSALRVQLDSQRTILCEGDAKIGELSGRLYVTAGAVEYYAGSANSFTNYFLIPLYDVKSVKACGSKLVIATKMKKFTLKVAAKTAKIWKKAIKEAKKLAAAPAPVAGKKAAKADKKAAKKAAKADKKAAKKAKKGNKKATKKATKADKKAAKKANKANKKAAKKANKANKKAVKKAAKANKKAAKKAKK